MSENLTNPESLSDVGKSRRNLLKLSAVGGVAMATGGLSSNAKAEGRSEIGIVKHDSFPITVSPDYKRTSETKTSFYRFKTRGIQYITRPDPDENKPGFTSIDYALKAGARAAAVAMSPYAPAYEGYDLPKIFKPDAFNPSFKFKDSATAHAVIKRAARHYGADLVGITRRDLRWDYTHVREFENIHPLEDALPFEAKTVIVLGFEVNYEALRAAPTPLGDSAMVDGYARMGKTAYQLAAFLHHLGFHSAGVGNSFGLSIPYAIAAGLGEPTRMGLLLNHKYGPRLRLAKVYTDLDLDEYFDKPVTFGVESFCENCMHCADNCPSNAISFDPKPSMAPPNDGNDWGFSNPGVRKWYVNCDKCLQYWADSKTSCSSCVSCCPYNKPDFWHHRLIDKVNTILPGPLHSFMADMDLLHGYGKTFDETAPAVFWDDKGREYNGLGD
ncbi:reductive dehalogenase [Vibrio sp. SS-MA-C1-2]|uniref:reductive dehalogenase n=1 Tax=Vibrio sp. SS-MA-C1-2 TaxID=2908646 RepID=UPI001F45C890|nr:reductive dehalogenase [Vibrio sp. SS-MA-C1-2]UJF17271.1 reductive dehalogenase [Vibrio sp. SS-MA-C1-2]